MSQNDGIFLVSRLLSIYFFCWMLSDVIYLPERIFSFLHYAHEQSVLASHSYFYTLDALSVATLVLRTILWLAVSVWFFRCGPRIQALFTDNGE